MDELSLDISRDCFWSNPVFTSTTSTSSVARFFARTLERAATHRRGLRAAVDADVLIPTYGIDDNTSCAGGDVKATARCTVRRRRNATHACLFGNRATRGPTTRALQEDAGSARKTDDPEKETGGGGRAEREKERGRGRETRRERNERRERRKGEMKRERAEERERAPGVCSRRDT